MRAQILPLLLSAVVSLSGRAASDSSSSLTDAIKARAAEDAKSPTARPTAPAKSPAAEAAAHPVPPPAAPPAKSETGSKPVSAEEAAKAKEQDPTVLDPVEVRKRKMTEFEQQTREQEAAMIREKKNTTPTEMDKALNDSKISKVFAIFGGQSGEQRANIAKERVSMMEDEKDMIEAIAHAKTKEEKQSLQKQLDELRKMRRELEKALR